MKNILLVILIVGFQLISIAQVNQPANANVVTIEGKTYLLHQVASGETLFSICKKYGVEQKELVGANPQLIFGLKEGDSLKVPYNGNVAVKDEPTTVENTTEANDQSEFIYHVVKKSETIYSISKEYNIPIQSIYKFNPEAEGEVLENEIIRIPRNADNTKVDGLMREDESFYYHKVQPKENVYSLARRYHATVGIILKYNPTMNENLEIGQIVRIPKFIEESTMNKVEDSGEYFMLRIEAGDTFYSYQRRFGVKKEDLVALNPELIDGLKTGLTIKIPTTKIQKIEVVPVQEDKFEEHIVSKGETLYSLSRLYNVSVLDIKGWNPELQTRGLVAGETVYIHKPKISETVETPVEIENEQVPEVTKPKVPELIFKVEKKAPPVCRREFSVLNDDTFRISMFWPFFFDENDAFNLEKRSDEEIAKLDSLKFIDKEVFSKHFKIKYDSLGTVLDTVLVDSLKVKAIRSLYPATKTFFNFYEGVLLAMDSLQKAGVKIRLDIYDSKYDGGVIDSILYNHDFINSDLIIGPINVKYQKSVSDFSAKNQIPMVSPVLQQDDMLLQNPFYFQVIPTKDYVLKKTSSYIGDQFFDKNFVVLTLGSYAKLKEADLVALVKDKFFSTGVYNKIDKVLYTEVDFTEGGTMGYWQVKKMLKPNMENVIFIPTTDDPKQREALVSRAINSLNVLAEEYKITLIGVSDYPRFGSINTEYFHRLNLQYLTPTYINYTNPDVTRFIQKYRKTFSTEPDKMSFMGYDVVKYFVDAYQALGKNYTECIGGFSTPLLQSDFNFQRVSEFSGFMNHTLFIMNYSRDYDVKKISKVTEGHQIIK